MVGHSSDFNPLSTSQSYASHLLLRLQLFGRPRRYIASRTQGTLPSLIVTYVCLRGSPLGCQRTDFRRGLYVLILA